MKRSFVLASVFCLFFFSGKAQSGVSDTVRSQLPTTAPAVAEKEETVIFTRTEQEARFPGGLKAWSEFLKIKLSSFDPAFNGAPRGKYKVVVKFIVSKTGKISDAVAATNYGYGMERAVLKMIKESPDWEPAYQNGRPVNAYRMQPVTFVVE